MARKLPSRAETSPSSTAAVYRQRPKNIRPIAARPSTKPPSEQKLLQLVGEVYDAATDIEYWPQTLDKLSDILGATYSVLHFRDKRTRRPLTLFGSRVASDVYESYQSYYYRLDPWAERIPALPQGTIIRGPELISWNSLKETEFYNDFLLQADASRIMGTMPLLDDGIMVTIGFYRADNEEEFDERAVAILEVLQPHIKHASRLLIERQRWQGLWSAGERAFDALPFGIVLLSDAGKILVTNRYARDILNDEDGLWLRNNRLATRDQRDQQQLDAAISNAVNPTILSSGQNDQALPIRRPSRARSYLLRVTSIHSIDAPRLTTPAAVVLFLVDPERQPNSAAPTLRRFFGLTKAEARLAEALAAGISLQEFSDETKRSMNTVRWTLKQLLAKTDTRRQAELVRVLLSAPSAPR